MEYNKELIEALNSRFSNHKCNLMNHEACMTQKEFNDLTQLGTCWNFNYITACVWFNENKEDRELSSRLILDKEFGDKMFDNIKVAFNTINKDSISQFNKIPTRNILENYIPLLLEHQKVSYGYHMINRWPYTSYIDIPQLETAFLFADTMDQIIDGKINLTKDDIEDSYSGNLYMRILWTLIEWGLYAEAMYLIKPLIRLIDKINSNVNIDGSSNDITASMLFYRCIFLSTLKKAEDIKRFELSVRIPYSLILVGLGKKEDAKDSYRKCVEMFPFNIDSHFKYIHYWTGQTRIIEAAVELWLLLEPGEERDELKDTIEKMLIHMYSKSQPENNREAVYEHLLVIRMLLDTVYEKEE